MEEKDIVTPQLLPYDIFEPKLKEFIDINTKAFGCPRDYMVAASVMAAVAVLGKKFRIHYPPYRNTPAMLMAIVGPSGTNKSSPLSLCLAPVREIDKEVRERSIADREYYISLNREVEKQNKKLPFAEREKLYPVPDESAIIITDSTPEARNQKLKAIDNSDLGLLISFDELPAFFKQFGRYNGGSEQQDLMSLVDGTGFSVSRKSQDTYTIVSPCLSVIGTIQNHILRQEFGKKDMLTNGFNQRWLFVFPECGEILMPDVSEETDNTRLWWRSYIRDIYDLGHDHVPPVVEYEPAALERMRQWEQSMVDQQNLYDREAPKGAYLTSIISKAKVNIHRWILACHFLSIYRMNPKICEQEVEFGLQCMAYFVRTSTSVCELLFSEEVHKKNDKGQEAYNEWLIAEKKGMTVKQFAVMKGFSREYMYRLIRKFSAKNKDADTDKKPEL